MRAIESYCDCGRARTPLHPYWYALILKLVAWILLADAGAKYLLGSMQRLCGVALLHGGPVFAVVHQ